MGAINPPLSTLQPKPQVEPPQNIVPKLSTNQSERYFMQSFMSVYNVGKDDGAGPLLLDLLDPKIGNFIDSITIASPGFDPISKPFTTVTSEAYNTTSLWWFLATFNGYMHPLERDPTVVFQTPNQGQISAFGNKMNKDARPVRGQVRTV